MVKRIILLCCGAVVISGATFLIGNSRTEKVFKEHRQADYHIFGIDVPKQMDFAGEPVPLNEYDVRERLDRELNVNVYWQSSTLLSIKRANRYFPLIVPILKKNGIPEDFKYLPLIESGFQDAVSPSGAEGYWQFIPETGKKYGLEINKEVDDRYNIEKSTEAACQYFIEAYQIFKNWTLVAASYNMGYDGLKKETDRQQVSSYYETHINQQTGRYVFRMLAMKEIMAHPSKYGFYYLKRQLYYPIATEKTTVSDAIPDLVAWAFAHGINYKILHEYNPWLRTYSLTNSTKETFTIEIPKDKNIIPGNIDDDTVPLSVTMPDRLADSVFQKER